MSTSLKTTLLVAAMLVPMAMPAFAKECKSKSKCAAKGASCEKIKSSVKNDADEKKKAELPDTVSTPANPERKVNVDGSVSNGYVDSFNQRDKKTPAK